MPAEAELWWTWRTWGPGHILPGAQYLELDAAVAEYRSRREWAATYGVRSVGFSEVSADDWWDPLWLPIFVVDSGIVLSLDLAQSDGSTVEVIQIDGQGFGTDSFAVTVAPSVGDFVAARLDAIDRGDFVYRRDIDLWLDASSG